MTTSFVLPDDALPSHCFMLHEALASVLPHQPCMADFPGCLGQRGFHRQLLDRAPMLVEYCCISLVLSHRCIGSYKPGYQIVWWDRS